MIVLCFYFLILWPGSGSIGIHLKMESQHYSRNPKYTTKTCFVVQICIFWFWICTFGVFTYFVVLFVGSGLNVWFQIHFRFTRKAHFLLFGSRQSTPITPPMRPAMTPKKRRLPASFYIGAPPKRAVRAPPQRAIGASTVAHPIGAPPKLAMSQSKAMVWYHSSSPRCRRA